jgi:predicted flap endonuclease-1-like 5' DNA nuclease
MKHVNEIEGIGEVHAKKLESIGITTVEQLLEAGKTPKGRNDLAAKTGYSEHHILKWVNQADLFRIHGIARQYAELLEAAGVDSVLELAQRNAEHLHEKLKSSNEANRQVHVVPGVATVGKWIEEAKALPRIVSY